MRCEKCNRYLGIFQRFCPKCGKAVTPKQRKKSLITFTIWVVLFLLFTAALYFILKNDVTFSEDFSNLHTFFISAFISLVLVELIVITYWIIMALARLIIRQPVFGSILLVIILAFGGLGYYAYWSDVSEKAFADSLSLIQDNLVELHVAKITGDSLIEKKPILGASWEKVSLQAQMVAGRLTYLSVPKGLIAYRESALSWANAVAEAAQENSSWQEVLPDHPVPFALKLSEKQAQKLFKDASKKIAELKEFGDAAIQTDSKVVMLYVGARLKVQRHWLEGVLYSEKKNSLLSALTPPVFAADFKNLATMPDPSGGCAVDVPYYQQTGKTRCIQTGATQPTPPAQPLTTPPQEPQQKDLKLEPIELKIDGPTRIQDQNPNRNQNINDPTIQDGVSKNIQSRSGEDYNVGSGKLAGTYNSATRRQVCIGRGGVSTGPAGNVYCLEDVVVSTTDIDSSAIEFAKGNKDAKNGWDNGWHNLEGAGLTVGEPTLSASGHSPTVQAFYDSCANKGGIVGGTGTTKTGLPTTESGYTCEYKNDEATGCWDFLTYSGGRYMGGNPGCAEQGTLPEFNEEKAKTANGGGKWDGIYVVSGGTFSCSGDFSSSLPIPSTTAPVINNVLGTTVGPLPINGNVAIYNLSIGSEEEGVFTSLNEIDSFRFYNQGDVYGVTASYDATITASKDGETHVAVCHGSVSGVRQ
ncbi:hypothetical protein JW752_05455 [Candidatus Peregrinibacteria bacterium]|nr:hypothetical protein [Candidatus Peregrinibacteria bacterium]